MREHGFDWFDYHGIDDDKIQENLSEKSYFDKVFDAISLVLFIIVCITFAFSLFLKQILYTGLYIYGVDIGWYNQEIMIFTGSFRFILFAMFLVVLLAHYLNFSFLGRALDVSYKLFTISIWMLIYMFNVEKSYYRETYICAMIISVVYGVFSILLMIFEENFIGSALKDKIAKTNRTEEVIRALKRYAYDIPVPIQNDNNNAHAHESFSIDFKTFMSYCVIFDEEIEKKCFSNVDPPEICCLKDAIRLARDVFHKAVPNGVEMGYNDVRSIFTADMFEKAKQCIDIHERKMIKKKEFRSIIAGFYYHRLSLTKSMTSQLHFVDIIKRLAYVPVSLVLLLTCLVIFGIDLKELFAVIVSSAVIVHFAGSPIVKDIWKGLMLVLSHRFDIGDEILINGEEMTVVHIGVISSSFVLNNGGVTKIFNSELSGKSIINMTYAPKNLLLFTFDLPSNMQQGQLEKLRCRISEYLRHRQFDFYDNFSIISSGPDSTNIYKLNTTVILKCKMNNSRSKNYMMRVDFTAYLNVQIEEIVTSGLIESSDGGYSIPPGSTR